MFDSPLATLHVVRRRLWYRRLGQGSAGGLFAGAVLGWLAAAAAMVLAGSAPQQAATLAGAGLLVGFLGGLGWGLRQRPSLRGAAATVDQYYAMKDRTVTALAFVQERTDDPLKRLQIANTAAHLAKVRAADCVPLVVSPPLQSAAVGALGLTLGLLAYAHWGGAAVAAASPAPLAVAEAERLRQSVLAEVTALAEQTGSEELETLREKLQQGTEQLAEQVRDQEDYFATLSAMEQAIGEAREALQTEQTAAALQSLAAAIRPAEALQGAAEALAGEEYQQAAQELQSFDAMSLDEPARRAVGENLQARGRRPDNASRPDNPSSPENPRPADEPPTAKTRRLQEAAEQLQQGLQQHDDPQTQRATEQIAEAAEQQAVAEALDDSLAQQLQRLSEAKGKGRNNGQSPSDMAQQTDRPSQSWGRAASGNPEEGETPALSARRQRQELRGQLGEGLSEKEMVAAEAREQTARRGYRDRYQRFRQQAEATLAQEPLPQGQRETIRRYFESIRPASN